MKTLILLLLPFSVFAQLDEYGEHFKTNLPASYEVIKTHAVEKWGDDYTMVIYQINKQSKACYELFQVFEKDHTKILWNAIIRWSYEGYKDYNTDLMNKGGDLLTLRVDWVMVKYDYDKQVKAKNSF